MNLGRVSSAALMASGLAGVVMPGRVAITLEPSAGTKRGMAETRAGPEARMDVTGEFSGGGADGRGVTSGNREIAAFVRASIDAVTTVHHGHTPEIDITSSTSATGIWAMEDHLWWPEGSPITTMHGYGHYHETYEKVEGRWLITSTTLTRLRTDVQTR